MTNDQPTHHRDPICGMTVNPATARFTERRGDVTWYFCSPACREQFIRREAHPRPSAPVRPRRSLARELRWIGLILLVAMTVAVTVRGFTRSNRVGAVTVPTVTGASAGTHRAVDDGTGGVIVSVTHDPRRSSGGQSVFTVSLDTHTAQLTGFNPYQQVRLRAGASELTPQTVVGAGERSSHHQNYRYTFAVGQAGSAWIIVRNVGGVGERQLPVGL